MLSSFSMKDYKCHEDYHTFDLPGMTIVSGINNAGKSSLLQAIYLITQARQIPYSSISLNSELKIGTFADALNKNKSNNDTLEFGMTFDENTAGFELLDVNFVYKNPFSTNISIYIRNDDPILYEIEITYKKRNCDSIKNVLIELVEEAKSSNMYKIESSADGDCGFCKVEGIVPSLVIYENLEMTKKKVCSNELEAIRDCLISLNKENIQYLRAFRLNESKAKNYSNVNVIGLAGEYTAELIYANWNNETDFENEQGEKIIFRNIFETWIKLFLGDNYSVESKKIEKGEYQIIIKDRVLNLELTLNQVGFGISQLLPILTMIISSRKENIILIETPEVHLHPKLQADLVDLFIFALKNNRKLVIETHSEHIINRARRRIKEVPELQKKINVLFFEKENNVVKEHIIEINKDGKIKKWPKNFFDQSYKDLLGLINQ